MAFCVIAVVRYWAKVLFSLSFLFFFLFSTGQHMQLPEVGQAIISGRIADAAELTKGDSLYVVYYPDFVSTGVSSAIILYAKIDAEGKFHFALNNLSNLGRLSMSIPGLGNLAQSKLVEAGDNIFIEITSGIDGHVRASYSGSGASKYSCSDEMSNVSDWSAVSKTFDPKRLLAIRDSLIRTKLAILEPYKSNVSVHAYDILKADAIGDIKLNFISVVFNKYHTCHENEKSALRHLISMTLNDDGAIDKPGQCLSPSYVKYLYRRSKANMAVKVDDISFEGLSATAKFSFKDLYQFISAHFRGSIRDRLLVLLLNNNWDIVLYFKDVDWDEFTWCLNDAMRTVRAPDLLNSVNKRLQSVGKGAKAYDFSLVDQSGRAVRLSDFLGKVVLIDIWQDPCGGCLLFKKNYLASVYPQVKDNKDFVVISVGMGNERGKWITGLSKYSHPSFINVFVGAQGVNHPLIQHYDISLVPTLMLVDRNGKILSCSLPYRTENDRLLEVIKNALSL